MRVKKSIKTSVGQPQPQPQGQANATEQPSEPHWAYLAGLANRDDVNRRHWTGEQLSEQARYQPGLPIERL